MGAQTHVSRLVSSRLQFTYGGRANSPRTRPDHTSRRNMLISVSVRLSSKNKQQDNIRIANSVLLSPNPMVPPRKRQIYPLVAYSPAEALDSTQFDQASSLYSMFYVLCLNDRYTCLSYRYDMIHKYHTVYRASHSSTGFPDAIYTHVCVSSEQSPKFSPGHTNIDSSSLREED